ncbi:MAG: hypothetical protein ABSA85_00715 [Terracidiphilus sp.]
MSRVPPGPLLLGTGEGTNLSLPPDHLFRHKKSVADHRSGHAPLNVRMVSRNDPL